MTKKDQKEIVLIACRRGRDQTTAGQSCPSNQAYKLSEDGSPVARFRCVKCGHTWAVPLGGSINI